MGSNCCTLCGYVACTREQLAGHRSGHVRRGELPKALKKEKKEYRCESCDKNFPTGGGLGAHRLSHKREFDKLLSVDSRKRHLIRMRGRMCECCKNSTWLDQPIPIHMDHVDGNPDNNKIDNLRLLCPNCHLLTSTWGSRNKGKFPNSLRSQEMKKRRSSTSESKGKLQSVNTLNTVGSSPTRSTASTWKRYNGKFV